MSPLKWLSLLVALMTAAATAAVATYAVGPAWRQAGGNAADVLLIALLVGTMVGGFLFVLACSFDNEVRRATAVVRSLIDGDANPSGSAPLRWRFGLGPLVDLVQHSQARLRGRVTELTVSRRAMDMQLNSVEVRRHHLEAVLNTIHEAVLVTDALDELVLANEAAAKLLNVDLVAALRRPAEEVIPDGSLVRMIRDTREGGRSVPRLLRRVQHEVTRGGDSNVVDVTMQCLSSAAAGEEPGEDRPGCGGVVTVLRDVTREVESAERRSEFVASVSHELRTPLSSIKGCLEMLIDGEAAEPEARNEFYHIIQSETNRLQRLVDNILSISRIESGLVRTAPRPLPLAELLSDAESAVRPHARSKGVEITRWDGAGAASCVVAADREMIQEVLLNLLNNAVKFTPTGGRITIGAELEPEGAFARVTVTDTGVGIPADAVPNLFQKFYRVQDHAHLGKGTGLGLNLVKHIIESIHGGTIGVTSEKGAGSAFTFTLPLADNTVRPAAVAGAWDEMAESVGEGRR